MEKLITSVEELINELGGLTPTSQIFGVSLSSAFEWKQGGFPGRHIPTLIYDIAPARGWVFSKDFFAPRHNRRVRKDKGPQK